MIDGQIKVVEVQSGQELFCCSPGEAEKAFQYAKSMEQMGVEVSIVSPSVSETLAVELGVNEGDWGEYQQSMEDEIEYHD